MLGMFIAVGFVTAAFVAALVVAAFADRRRSNEVDADASRFAPAPNDPDELVALGRQIAASPMVARHLSGALRKTKYPADGRA